MYENEFKTLLEKNFKEVKLLGQYSCAQSVVCSPDQAKIENYYSGDYNSVKTTSGPEIVYWIAMASDNPLPHVNNSSFLHSFSISDLLQKESEAVKKTLTYRIGHFILYPFKCLKALFSR